MDKVRTWSGPRGFGVVLDLGRMLTIVAASNGKRWTAVRTRRPAIWIKRWARGAKLYNRDGKMHVRYATLAEWAGQWTTHPDRVAQSQCHYPRNVKILALAGKARGLGSVFYVSFPADSAHTLAALHREISARVATGHRVWKWKPVDLQVSFMGDGRAMGMAYIPRYPRKGEPQTIALNSRLLARYALESVGRTVIHELCHHYREERFLRPTVKNWHDAVFCRELAKADPIVAKTPVECEFFMDVEAPNTRGGAKPVWKVSAGHLLVQIASVGTTFVWESDKPGTWHADERTFNDVELLAFLKRFPSSAWPKIRVKYAGKRWPANDLPSLIRLAVPSSIPLSMAYIRGKMPGFRSNTP